MWRFPWVYYIDKRNPTTHGCSDSSRGFYLIRIILISRILGCEPNSEVLKCSLITRDNFELKAPPSLEKKSCQRKIGNTS